MVLVKQQRRIIGTYQVRLQCSQGRHEKPNPFCNSFVISISTQHRERSLLAMNLHELESPKETDHGPSFRKETYGQQHVPSKQSNLGTNTKHLSESSFFFQNSSKFTLRSMHHVPPCIVHVLKGWFALFPPLSCHGQASDERLRHGRFQ